MAKRPKTTSTTRPSARRSRKGGTAASDHPTDAKDRSGSQGRSRTFDELADELFDPSALLDRTHPLGRLNALLLMQSLEFQSAALDLYQRALQEGAFDAPAEDHMRKVARSMMGAYLDLMKSMPERRERLITRHAELVKGVSEALEDLRRKLAEPAPDSPGKPHNRRARR